MTAASVASLSKNGRLAFVKRVTQEPVKCRAKHAGEKSKTMAYSAAASGARIIAITHERLHYPTPAAPQPGRRNRKRTMTIKNPTYVHNYITMVTELRSALANLAEFVDTLPAPDDDMNIPGMDYAQLGDVGRLHELIGEACQITCEISE